MSISRSLLLLAGLALFSIPDPLHAQTGLVKPYLQSATPTGIVIQWETNLDTESVIEYGLTESLGLSQSGTALTTLGSTQLHSVPLTGLEPGTRYFYKARTGSWQSGVYDFRTPPQRDSEEPVNIVLMSDMQKGGEQPTLFHDLVNTSVLPYVAAHYGAPLSEHVQMAVLPGDLVDVGSNYNQWKNDFFNPAEVLWRSVPIYPAIGNHEGNSQNYFNYFTLPENGTPGYLEHWYYTDYSNVRVFSLNTNGPYRIQPQLDWLDSMLSASCADTLIDFVFAEMHHPFKSELWTPGETDYTGLIVERLEAFSDTCGKPTVHFFGHTHAYSRGESRDHRHLWINVATAGGNIDNWGEFPNADYEEYIISTDDYGFVMVEVTAGAAPKFVMKRLSFGDQNNPGGTVLTDSMVIRLDNALPVTPYPLYPLAADTVSPFCVSMKADAFLDPDGDGFGAAHWQVSRDSLDFDTLVGESWKQYANWYNEVDLQAADDLTDESFDLLPSGETLWWRVRYRDKALGWSEWSTPARFHTIAIDTLTGNLVQNGGAESGITGWTVTIGTLESLDSAQCASIAQHSGTKLFSVGGNCNGSETPFASAYQDADVSDFASLIDAGEVTAHFGAWLSAFAANNDKPAIALQCRDASNMVIAISDTLSFQSTPWTLKEMLFPVPAGTRTLRVNIMGTRLAGVDNDSYVDDVFLELTTAFEGCFSYEPPGPSQGRLYVDADAPAQPDGKSWTTAYRSLGAALEQSNTDTTVSEIWIAEGLYPVTQGTDRDLSFHITRSVDIHGGFAGTENNLEERNIAIHPVVLSGEIGDTSIVTDNSRHVMLISSTIDTLRLDGLTISGGYADGPGDERAGALITFASNREPVLLDSCQFADNHGVLTGTILNQCQLFLSNCQLDQDTGSGSSPVAIRNEGVTAVLRLIDTTLFQQGPGSQQGIENVDGAKLKVIGAFQIQYED